jgi:hypothetical protein
MAHTMAKYKTVPLAVQVDTPAAHVAADAATAQMVPAAEAQDYTPKVEDGDASVAFQGQIDALRNAEASQRERTAQGTPALPPTRALRLQHWRDQGFDAAQAEYFNALHENPQRTQAALAATHDMGINPNDVNFHNEVQKNFHHLAAAEAAQNDLQAAYDRGDVNGQADATNRISKSNTALARGGAVDEDFDTDRRRGRIVSAPVSRETMSTMGGSYNERPGRVTLSAAQKDAARFSGISEAEYAAQVLRLRAEKAEGNHGGSP